MNDWVEYSVTDVTRLVFNVIVSIDQGKEMKRQLNSWSYWDCQTIIPITMLKTTTAIMAMMHFLRRILV